MRHRQEQQGHEASPDKGTAEFVIAVHNVDYVHDAGAHSFLRPLDPRGRESESGFEELPQCARQREVDNDQDERNCTPRDGESERLPPLPCRRVDRRDQRGDHQVDQERLPRQERERARERRPEPPATDDKPHRQDGKQDAWRLGVRSGQSILGEAGERGEHDRGDDAREHRTPQLCG
jgi:hypothetical protein